MEYKRILPKRSAPTCREEREELNGEHRDTTLHQQEIKTLNSLTSWQYLRFCNALITIPMVDCGSGRNNQDHHPGVWLIISYHHKSAEAKAATATRTKSPLTYSSIQVFGFHSRGGTPSEFLLQVFHPAGDVFIQGPHFDTRVCSHLPFLDLKKKKIIRITMADPCFFTFFQRNILMGGYFYIVTPTNHFCGNNSI